MADIPIPPIPPRRAPLIDIMRELEVRPRARQSSEFDPVAAMVAERRSQSRQSLPLPPIPPAVAPPRTAGDSAEAGPPRDLSSVSPTIRDRLPENNPYVSAAIDIAEKYNLPRDVFLSLVHQESRFDPKAKSPRGAFGLTQLMPGTARDLGVDPRDPMANLDAGARYLRQQIDRFGSLPLALAAYNSGPGRVIKSGNQIPNIRETQNYVSDILRNAGMEGTVTDQRYGFAEGGLADLDEKYAEGGRVRRPAAAPVASPFDADYIERLAAQAVGAGEPVAELRSAEGRGFAPMPRSFGEAGQRMSAVIRGDVEPTPEEERQMNVVRGFTEGPASIRAYHGSPYAFERFDISKIGTGEGAQAYGRGLYFAENPDVALEYKQSLIRNADELLKIAQRYGLDNDAAEMLAQQFSARFGGQRFDSWLNSLSEAIANPLQNHRVKTAAQQILDKSVEAADAYAAMKAPGHMYEVRLRTTPEEMVNWNAPLVQQPERAIPFLEDVLRAPRTGSARVLEREMKPIGEAVNLRTPEVAAQLREAGIPGLRYLDAGSRSGGRGTRNYVMFGDDLIDITRRYAEGGLAALDEKYADGGTVRAPSFDVREPYESELKFFEKNPNVSGMATEDNKVILNPNSNLSKDERDAVILNERARLAIRNKLVSPPDFDLTPEQSEAFSQINNGRPYGNMRQIRETIAARILSGDPSALNPTADQMHYAQQLREALKGYAEGGTVRAPKETTIAGQDHKLAYITDREAALLKARGGSGRMTDYGVRAYDEGPGGEGPGGEGPGGDPSDNAGSMSDPSTQDAAGGNAGQGAGPTGAGAGPTGEQGPGPTGEDTGGEETSVTAPTTAPTPNTGAFGQFGTSLGFGVVGGLAGFGIGVPGLGTIGSAIGAAIDAGRANEQLGMMGLSPTVDRDTAALNAVSMGAFGQSVANQFGQALGFDALAEAPMSAFSTPDPLGDIAASQMDSGGSQYEQTEYGTPGLSNIATSMAPATAASLVDWNQIQREASAMNMSVSDYLAMKWRSPAPMARGGMASLEQMHAKYAEGGPVVSVYDPDEINDLANQILEGAYV